MENSILHLSEAVRNQLISDCQKEIDHLMQHIETCERQNPPMPTVAAMSMLTRQQIALSFLTNLQQFGGDMLAGTIFNIDVE